MANKNFLVKNGLDIGDNITIADDGSIIGLDTDDLNEGTTNVYYTDARVDTNFGTKTTDALTEGTTNLYYASALFDTDLATKSTTDLAEGTNLYYTDARVSSRINNTSVDALSDVVITSGTAGQMMYYDGTNWVNSANINSANLNRFLRTNSGTGSNAVLAISRNRTDAARAVDNGPWLGFEYVGTDNTQGTAPQNAIRSRYQTSGDHQLQFLQLPGTYTSLTVMGQIQRGSTFFNNTFGGNMLLLTDTAATVRGTTTTIANSANTSTYATFALGGIALNNITTITGAGLHQMTRTTVGTPGTQESRPSFNIQLSRSDQAAPNNFDGTGFRYRVNGSNGTNYTIADMSANYTTGGDNIWSLNLANGDQTGATFDSLATIQSKISQTTIRAGTASATPGGSTVNDIMVISDDKILNNRAHRNAITTGTVARGGNYTVPATPNGSIELTVTAGSGTTNIDVDAVASDAGTGGMYSILIYNNSGDNNISVQVRNNGVNIGVAKNLDIGDRAMASVYVVGGYAACEIMDAA